MLKRRCLLGSKYSRSFSPAGSKSSPISSSVLKMSCTFGPAQCKNSACFLALNILYIHRHSVYFKSFEIFPESSANWCWIQVRVKRSKGEVCITCSHLVCRCLVISSNLLIYEELFSLLVGAHFGLLSGLLAELNSGPTIRLLLMACGLEPLVLQLNGT